MSEISCLLGQTEAALHWDFNGACPVSQPGADHACLFEIRSIPIAGRQLDGALPDPLRGEAVPVLGVQPPVLAVEQRHHAHAHAQRREAVQVGGFKACTESASSSHTRLIWRKFPTRLLHI